MESNLGFSDVISSSYPLSKSSFSIDRINKKRLLHFIFLGVLESEFSSSCRDSTGVDTTFLLPKLEERTPQFLFRKKLISFQLIYASYCCIFRSSEA